MNKNIKIFINYFVGPVLFIWLCWSIYNQIIKQDGLQDAFVQIKYSLRSYNIIYLFVAILLMFVNWSIEAYKWMIAVKEIQKVSFGKAIKAVFAGISFSITTPNSIGDYVGRVLYINEGNRIKAVSLTIVANVSQLITTFLMGTIALFFLKNNIIQIGALSTNFANTFLYSSALITIILTLFYFRLPWLLKIIDKLPFIKKVSWAIEAVKHLDATILLRFLSLSVIRFMVFSSQYYLLFKLYRVQVSAIDSWQGLSVLFLVMAIIPTIAIFTDLGLKNELSIRIMGIFSNNHLGIGLTTLSVWLINLVVPALIGSLFVLGIKNIFKPKREYR